CSPPARTIFSVSASAATAAGGFSYRGIDPPCPVHGVPRPPKGEKGRRRPPPPQPLQHPPQTPPPRTRPADHHPPPPQPPPPHPPSRVRPVRGCRAATPSRPRGQTVSSRRATRPWRW